MVGEELLVVQEEVDAVAGEGAEGEEHGAGGHLGADAGWWMVAHTPELTSSPSLVWCRSIRLQAHSQRWWERQASSLHATLQKVTAAHLAAECVKRGSKSSPMLQNVTP